MANAEHVDVIVIGAGLAGLTTAWRLMQGGMRKVRILEARDRVGGRTLTENGASGPMDMGAQWVGPSQHRILQLASELGLRTFASPYRGRHIMLLDGERHVYRGVFPLKRWDVGLDFLQAALRLEWAARKVPVREPWSAPEARTLDHMCLGDWLRQHTRTEGAKALFRVASGLTLGGDPDDLSLLWVMQHVRRAGGFVPLLTVHGGAQDRRLVDGAQSVSQGLARRLSGLVQTTSPVERICWDERGATVQAGGRAWRARQVVVAMSPADRARIQFDPPLPEANAQLHERMSLFKGLKVHLVYDRPFWRDQGLSGQALSDIGPAPVVFDNSRPDRPEGVLVSFVAGKTGADPMLPTSEQLTDATLRRQAVIAAMVRCFGPQAATPREYVEKDWRDEPWSAGCIPAMAPGLITDTGAQAVQAVGPFIWAGTETADRWGGYMDGAVRSGEVAARQIIDGLPGLVA
jgi:monoamine oxidase